MAGVVLTAPGAPVNTAGPLKGLNLQKSKIRAAVTKIRAESPLQHLMLTATGLGFGHTMCEAFAVILLGGHTKCYNRR